MKRTEDLVKKYRFTFTKSIGQNFLKDERVLEDIISGAEVNASDHIIEIGPGLGTLTRELLMRAGKVTAIELDRKLIPILTEELKEFSNFELINEDIMKCDLNEIIGEEKNIKVVANLPYYITTPVLSKLISGNYNINSINVMVQKEVGDRMNAAPNTKDYGSLSLLIQYYCDTKIIRYVEPECFVPSPKVDSVVVRLDLLGHHRVEVEDEVGFFKIIRDSFNMRRKTLWNSLKGLGFDKEYMIKAFDEAGIDPKRRGETLSIHEFAKLSNCIFIK